MPAGAEDYTNEVTIQGQDEDGNPVTVQVTAAGVMQAVMQGVYDSTLKTIQTDEAGRMSTLLYGMYGAEPTVVSVDVDGRLSFSDMDQAAINPEATEALLWTDPLTSLVSNLNRIRWSIVQITGEAWGTVTHEMNDYVLRDGSLALTADWDIGDGCRIEADQIRARDAAGLALYDDSGVGIFIVDGGHILIAGATDHEAVNLDGRLYLEDVAAPGTTANKLYSVGGTLYWNAIDLTVVGQWSVNGDKIYYNDGNVGIGTNDPAFPLSVVDTIAVGEGTCSSTVGRVRITWKPVDDYGYISAYQDGYVPFRIDCDPLVLNSGPHTNVGIDERDPSYKLDVNGDFGCSDQAAVNTDATGAALWMGVPTGNYCQIIDAGTVGGTEESWIQLTVDGWTSYLRGYTAK